MESLTAKLLWSREPIVADNEGADLCGPAEAELEPGALRITKTQEMIKVLTQATGTTGDSTANKKRNTAIFLFLNTGSVVSITRSYSEPLQLRQSGGGWFSWHTARPHPNRNNSGTAGSIEMREATLERRKVQLASVCVMIQMWPEARDLNCATTLRSYTFPLCNAASLISIKPEVPSYNKESPHLSA